VLLTFLAGVSVLCKGEGRGVVEQALLGTLSKTSVYGNG